MTQSNTSRAETLSTDSVFEILSNRRRRYVLHYLNEFETTATVRDLSEQLAAWENDVPRSEIKPKERKRLYTALHQTHLPKMHQRGVIEYDRDRGTVAATAALASFDIYFRAREAAGFPWRRWALGLSSLLLLSTVAGAVGLTPFARLQGFDYALVGAFTFFVVALGHTLADWDLRTETATKPPELMITPQHQASIIDADDD